MYQKRGKGQGTKKEQGGADGKVEPKNESMSYVRCYIAEHPPLDEQHTKYLCGAYTSPRDFAEH
jgi:hypothetical protein